MAELKYAKYIISRAKALPAEFQEKSESDRRTAIDRLAQPEDPEVLAMVRARLGLEE